MIIDSIANASRYYCLGGRIKRALEYLETTEFSKVLAGDYSIDGDDVFVKVREYPDGGRDPLMCVWEGHKKFLDIHYVAEGIERFGYSDIKAMTEQKYHIDKDQVDLAGEGEMLTVHKGFFIITFTNDIHLPCVRNKELPYLKKVVVKVRL